MKRLIAICLSLLMLVSFSAHAAFELSDSAKESYLKWIERNGGSWTYALAVSPNGGYAAGWGHTIYDAKKKAVKECKKITKSTSCKIMDVDGKSAFIKKRGISGSSSYSNGFFRSASSSVNVWCATKNSASLISRYSCNLYAGKAFNSQSQAQAEHKRLKAASSTASSSGSLIWCGKSFKESCSSTTSSASAKSKYGWCATKDVVTKQTRAGCDSLNGKMFASKSFAQTEHKRLKAASSTASSSSSTASSSVFERPYCYSVIHDLFYRPATAHCSGSAKKVSKREYTNKRLDSSSTTTTASSSSSNLIWCATKNDYLYQKVSACKAQGGKSYSSMSLAKAEHKRLKAVSTPVVKTASLTIRSNVTGDSVYIDGIYKGSTRLDLKLSKGRHTIRIEKDGYKTYEESIKLTDNLIIRGHLIKIVDEPVKTVVVDNTVEVEFWNSIKGSDDPEEYRIYLDEYPTGKFSKLAKLRIKKLGGDTTSVAQSSIPNLDYGDYYALVIGNNRYQHLGNLRTAVNDARSVANLLELDYGFNVTKLENANRDEIIKSISGLRSKVSSQDNVLIYYAGHGYLDEAADEGFWLPTDSDRTDQSNWLAIDRVVGQVRAMKAKHVMVVADSCFSGTITRGIKIAIKQPTREWLETIVKKKARTALTSGGLEPVMDSGGGNNSVFANSFLSILRDNDGVLDASQLFSQLRPKVMVNSDQTPEYGDIHRAGHDGGDFLFVRR